MTNEHIAYVRAELDRGVAVGDLQNALLAAGYSQSQINELFAAVQGAAKTPPTPPILLTNTPVPQMATQTAQSNNSTTYEERPAKTGMPSWLKVLLGVLGFLVLATLCLVFVVMASLNSARDNATEASAKTSLNTLRSQAEVYYSTSGQSYEGVCADVRVQGLLNTAVGQADCAASADSYRVSLELSDGYYCVDSVGFADKKSELLVGFVCQ